jgi:hypothetical protein
MGVFILALSGGILLFFRAVLPISYRDMITKGTHSDA